MSCGAITMGELDGYYLSADQILFLDLVEISRQRAPHLSRSDGCGVAALGCDVPSRLIARSRFRVRGTMRSASPLTACHGAPDLGAGCNPVQKSGTRVDPAATNAEHICQCR